MAALFGDWRKQVTLRQWEKVTLPHKCNIFTDWTHPNFQKITIFLLSDSYIESTMESKFYPKLTNAEAADILRSNTASDKFSLSTQALARKLGRLDDDAAEAIAAVKNEVTSTTAHSDLSEIVRFSRRECDSAMDYFASVMDLYRPADGVITRAQADPNYLGEHQTRNLEIYLEADALKVKFKAFLAGIVAENRKLQDDFVTYSTKCKNESDLKMRIETKGISSHEALRPRDKGDLSLSVVELERWVVEATNWATSSHFEYEDTPCSASVLGNYHYRPNEKHYIVGGQDVSGVHRHCQNHTFKDEL